MFIPRNHMNALKYFMGMGDVNHTTLNQFIALFLQQFLSISKHITEFK